MSFEYGWDESIDGVVTSRRLFVSEALANGEGALKGYIDRVRRQIAANPQILLPGAAEFLVAQDGTLLSVLSNGNVYLDGRRLGTARVACLVQLGKSTYGKGATDGLWWRWTGSTWVQAPDIDPRLLYQPAPVTVSVALGGVQAVA